jgi:hypothetical protein
MWSIPRQFKFPPSAAITIITSIKKKKTGNVEKKTDVFIAPFVFYIHANLSMHINKSQPNYPVASEWWILKSRHSAILPPLVSGASKDFVLSMVDVRVDTWYNNKKNITQFLAHQKTSFCLWLMSGLKHGIIT